MWKVFPRSSGSGKGYKLLLRIRVHAGKAEEKEIEVRDGSNYYDLLGALKLNPETVVIFRDGVPVSFDAPVAAGKIEVLRVVSGG